MTAASRLGRGLSSLIPTKQATQNAESGTHGPVHRVPVSSLHVNRHQPRGTIEPKDLEELVASIREHGILQPLIVMPAGDGYELIAGERRFQAARMLGLTTVPVVVREATEQQQLELALVENLQRKDLNPLEEAEAFQKLVDEFNLTQEQIAKKVGKSRSHIANTLRLLGLPEVVKNAILDGTITEGHAKVLLSVDSPAEQRALLDKIIAHGLSVRAGEALVASRRPNKRSRTAAADPNLNALQESLQRALGTKVAIERRGDRGTITISFFSREELTALIKRLSNGTND